jgi:hypothetical protein
MGARYCPSLCVPEGARLTKAARLTLAGAVALAEMAARGEAAPRADEGRWSAAAAPVVSVQPEGHAGAPYLSKPLGGSVVGLAFVVQRRVSPRAGIALELGSALAIKDPQTGRFIFGSECYFPGCPNPVMSTQRDTIANLLASLTLGDAEVKAGPGLARSVTHQGDDELNQYDRTSLVLTAGLDVVLPIGRRLSLVPTARYHFVFRGEERMYGGLSRSIVRLGVGVRLGGAGAKR